MNKLVNALFLIVLTSLFISCGIRAQDIELCEESFRKGHLKDCYNCTKEYLESNPTDTNAMILIVKCAQSQDEFTYVDKFMKTHYKEHSDNSDFWIAYGDLLVKSGDSIKADKMYSVADHIIFSKEPHTIVVNGRNDTTTSYPNYYNLALKRWEYYKKLVTDERFISQKHRESFLNEILNHLNRELAKNPNDSASLALKKEVEAILNE